MGGRGLRLQDRGLAVAAEAYNAITNSALNS